VEHRPGGLIAAVVAGFVLRIKTARPGSHSGSAGLVQADGMEGLLPKLQWRAVARNFEQIII
jgi:hypothetical protein